MSPTIGQSATRRIEIRICKACGHEIDDTGLCSQGCDRDYSAGHPPGSFTVRVYERTDVFVEERG